MKFESIGTREASQLRRDGSGQAGFTLLEALVALAVILAFAAVLGPHLSQARRIMADAAGRVAAQVLLRSWLDAPFDRSTAASMSRDGETAGGEMPAAVDRHRPAANRSARSRGPARDQGDSFRRVVGLGGGLADGFLGELPVGTRSLAGRQKSARGCAAARPHAMALRYRASRRQSPDQ